MEQGQLLVPFDIISQLRPGNDGIPVIGLLKLGGSRTTTAEEATAAHLTNP